MGWAWAEGPTTRVAILAGAHDRYRVAATELEAQLRGRGVDSVLVELPPAKDETAVQQALRRLTEANPTVIAAAGEKTALLALQTVPDVPVLFFMVPNAQDAEFVAHPGRYPGRVAGISADVSPSQQIDWIRTLQPQCRKLAVFFSSSTRRTVEAVRGAAEQNGIIVAAIEAKIDEFPKAVEALTQSHCDGVLMLPDPRVYNSPNVQQLILWGLRHKKPVWAFSDNIVKAGAFAGQFVDPRANGREATELVVRLLKGTQPSEIGLMYSQTTKKAVNQHTADRLGISLREQLGSDVTMHGGSP